MLWKFLFVCIFAVDLVLVWTGVSPLQVTRALRPFFLLVKRRRLAEMVKSILTSIPRMGATLCLLVLSLYIFAIIGVMLFNSTIPEFLDLESKYSPGMEGVCSAFITNCNDYFSNILSAFYALFQLVQKVNWPVVMYPYYQRAPLSASFFILFLLLNHFFILRLLLAAGSISYKAHLTEVYTERKRRANESTDKAFDVLAERGVDGNPSHITFDKWIQVQ